MPRPGVCHHIQQRDSAAPRSPDRSGSTHRPRTLSLVSPAPREDVPHEHGLHGTVVVEDHPPVAHAQPEVLATREPPDIERAIIRTEGHVPRVGVGAGRTEGWFRPPWRS